MYKAHKTHKAAFTAHLRGASKLPLRLDAGNTRKSVAAVRLTPNLLDRRYTNVVTFAMLARQISPGHLPTSANSFTAILLQPLGALFRPSSLYNQQFTDSFVKIGGVGYTPTRPNLPAFKPSAVPPRFAPPAFSPTYKSLTLPAHFHRPLFS